MKCRLFILFLLPLVAFANQEVPRMPPKNATRSARTCPDLNGVYVTGEFLYWEAKQDELEYAAAVDLNLSQTLAQIQFKIFELDFKYKPAFRIGLGGDLPWNGWDIYLNWTHFDHDFFSSHTSNQTNLVLLAGNFEGFEFVGSRASERWNLSFNSLDADWGRRFFLGSSWIVRPSFGLKTVWICQDVEKRLENVESFNPNGPGVPGDPEFQKFHFDAWGIGPYGAFYGKWNWVYGLGVSGQVSGALLCYNVDGIGHAGNNRLQGQNVSFNDIRLKYSSDRIRPMAQAFIGLDWEWCFIPKWLSTQLAIGYEVQYYWPFIVDPIDSRDDVSLTFQGLTLKARLDF